ncbi:23S rRNA (pseudouridine1915-N3)-methyltransferase [Sphingobacterium allocomposti]|uniref:Ribosomal RNA large subunit methyltransferase H n=1 Tax=Sphingobacterium allocomposti TaxID=415956 RepID=A0A5S5DMN5_9SPHI|nr:23S rRNA (pseudouridine(1915)-N(3))-methyltransferase RlmH [Sphingobacterium composti Yoo et al. 2007 non Ten et al. 2007]TYP97203.1 23S rRNA (pseudouridine1915-N3)-methyltransferase [Sphingobacterium composti Yoo et al. 2007 non Ten et al. 2007]HLS94607.1 23S rRNA (pseudouridine(1915)-N(3))-methyltransferase RlmH [Sphingobacterium sp.]
MKICLLCIGKTDEEFVKLGIENYTKRLKHYINFELIVIPDIRNAKNISQEQQKVKEGELLLKQLSRNDVVILLDERGKEFRSIDFSRFLEQKMIASVQRLVFIIGGPYGFSSEVYQRANQQLSLSKMTFSHQMIRLFFIEQVYRAFTIMRGEPYHHE